jgi:23S rRNA (cytidine1920-2'-O)/16S rRNA (cytidine1409-2'-O)-methyltransferase
MPKTRADQLAVTAGLAETRSQAKALIMAGRILADGAPVDKPGHMLADTAVLTIKGDRPRFVSRGGDKLDGALKDLGLDVNGLYCLDIGASTGGFTDCLLQRKAAGVTAVDVGYGLLDYRLRSDDRVRVVEKTNARYLSRNDVGGPFDLAVVDVSFISSTLILPNLAGLMNPGGRILVMVKPQFEVGKKQVGAGGVVRDPALQAQAVDRVAAGARELGLIEAGRAASRVKGPKGNQEHFLLLTVTG